MATECDECNKELQRWQQSVMSVIKSVIMMATECNECNKELQLWQQSVMSVIKSYNDGNRV